VSRPGRSDWSRSHSARTRRRTARREGEEGLGPREWSSLGSVVEGVQPNAIVVASLTNRGGRFVTVCFGFIVRFLVNGKVPFGIGLERVNALGGLVLATLILAASLERTSEASVD